MIVDFYRGLKFVLHEHIVNYKLIWILAIAHMKKQTLRTSLGVWWILIRDTIYFSAFSLFRYIMIGSREIDGMHFLLYLLSGFIPWFSMNEIINVGVGAIVQNSNILHSIKFPISILTTIEGLAILMRRIFTWVILIIGVYLFGDIFSINLVLICYGLFCMIFLMWCYSLFVSPLYSVSSDFKQLYKSMTSILIFFNPILWNFSQVPDGLIKDFLRLNPFSYVLETIRSGVRGELFLEAAHTIDYLVYFWGLNLVMLFMGSFLQYKLRKYYQDFI